MTERLRICLVRDEPGSRHWQPIFREFEHRFDVTTHRVIDEAIPERLDDLGDVRDVDAIVWFVYYRPLRQAPDFDWQGYDGLRVFYEFDGYQNFRSIANSHNKGTFPTTFRRMKFDVMVTSGSVTRELLEAEGIHARWIPKGYDPNSIFDLRRSDRTGVGHFGSRYPARLTMLHKVRRAGIPVEDFRVKFGELNAHLNRYLACIVCNMDFYGSGVVPVRAWKHLPEIFKRERAGIEPMIKNYEVAGAGCAPFCDYYEELETLGFTDGETMVFYRSFSELIDKLQHYRSDPDQLRRLGSQASSLVSSRHTWRHRMVEFEEVIRSELGARRD